MIVPDEEEYTQRRYLRDAFRAWRTHWSVDIHSYTDGALDKHAGVSAWEELAPIFWFLVTVCVGIAVLVIASAHQGYHVMPYHGNTRLPKFVVPTSVP